MPTQQEKEDSRQRPWGPS